MKSNIKQNVKYSDHMPCLKGIQFLTLLRLGLSHLFKHKFKHSFQGSLNSFCVCSSGRTESSSHYLLHYSFLMNGRMILLNSIRKINPNILNGRMAFLNSIRWINPNLLKQNGSLVTGIFFLHDDAFQYRKEHFNNEL